MLGLLNENTHSVKTWLSANSAFAARDTDADMTIHFAAWSGNVEVVTWWINQARDLNARDKYGLTPLHLAVWNLHLDAAKVLLDGPTASLSPTPSPSRGVWFRQKQKKF